MTSTNSTKGSTSQNKTLRKLQDTVLLDAVLAGNKDKSRQEVLEFVYNTSHIWSQHHPEKAVDCFADNCIANGWGSEPMKGIQPVINRLMKIYDSVQDFHFIIKDVIVEGDLYNGKITVTYNMTGECVVAPDGTKFIDTPFKVYGVYVWKIQNKKVVIADIYIDIGNTDERALNVITTFNKMASFLM